MKNQLFKTLIAIICSVFVFTNQTQAQSFESFAGLIRSGNSSGLAASFQSNVEITIKDSGNSYSKSQAEMVLKNFFSTHQPKSFTIAHQGTSPEGAKYFIGNLSTSSGNFRTYVYAKSTGGSLAIQEIRFEEQ